MKENKLILENTGTEETANSIFSIYDRILSDRVFLGKMLSKEYNLEALIEQNGYQMSGKLKIEFVNFVNQLRDLVYNELNS